MRKLIWLLALSATLAACSSQYTPIRVLPPPAVKRHSSNWELTWQYDPAQLAQWNAAPWSVSNRWQITCYTSRDASYSRDLLLRITSQPCAGRPESGAWLQSPQRYLFGEFVARIYLPASASGTIANWPAFWLEDPDQWPVNGEIDVMEGLGGWDCQQLHYGPAPRVMLSQATSPECVSDATGWHTYAVEWSPGRVSWFIDGKPTGVVTSHVTSKPMMLVLDYTAWRHSSNQVSPATMRVAWVRVYKHI